MIQPEQLYTQHVPAALRLAYLMTGDDATAQDVAHDAFVKAASKRTLMRDPEQFAAYLRRTVVRTVLMRRRSSEREAARIDRASSGRPDRIQDIADGVADHLDLSVALDALPLRQRAALVLRYFNDLPEAEIARILGCAPGTVKSSLSRALTTLREVVSADV